VKKSSLHPGPFGAFLTLERAVFRNGNPGCAACSVPNQIVPPWTMLEVFQMEELFRRGFVFWGFFRTINFPAR
jgi:hypothetical protein